jgi:cob(I)alamin adenosyltransferase
VPRRAAPVGRLTRRATLPATRSTTWATGSDHPHRGPRHHRPRDGTRTSKDLRIAALGDVDSSTRDRRAAPALPTKSQALLDIQHDLFDLGGELCIPGYENVDDSQVTRLDDLLAHFNAALPRLQEFILPGGSRPAAIAHVARTVARRAERAIVALGANEPVRPACRQYVNRLSDLLFVLARVLNRSAGGADVLWQQGRNKAPKAE